MKRALLSIAAIVLSAQGFAQVILDDTSFANPVGTTDTFRYITSGYNSTMTTTDPDNMRLERPTGFVWWLQGLSYNYTKAPRVIQHIAATGYDYANKTLDTLNHKTHGTVTNFVQLTYMPEYLTSFVTTGADSGINEYGIKIPAEFGVSLTSLPGGAAMDSIIIPAQTAMYYSTTIGNQPDSRVKFRFRSTYPTATLTESYQDTIHGILRYAAAGYVDTPFHIKTEVVETKRYVGYGKLRFRKTAYMTTPSPFTDTLNVLQVRCSLQLKDFYYIGDNLADSTALSYLGVQGQGTTRLYYFDEYYRRSKVEPVLTMRFTDVTFGNATSNQSDANLSHLNPLEVAAIANLSTISIYPNPVKGGAITVDGINTKWNYAIHNVNGQLIQSGAVDKGSNKVQLPANIAAGNYFMSLENENESLVKTLTIAE